METPERVRATTEAPVVPLKRRRIRRRGDDDDDHDDNILVRFVETKVYSSGHVEYASGRRFFKRRLDLKPDMDLDAMNSGYLTFRPLYDLENTGAVVRLRSARHGDEGLTYHQLVLIKIT